MIDATKYQAFIQGSREDVVMEGILSVDPNKVIGRRKSKTDAEYANLPKNKEVFPEFDPWNIYQVKVLPADERSIHKFNGATFDRPDGNHVPSVIEAVTPYTLPYWLGVYHGML